MNELRSRRAFVLLGALLAVSSGAARPADWHNHIVTRWDGIGATGNATSGLNIGLVGPALSADGRVVAFDSYASNLIPTGPTVYTNTRNAFVSDLATGAVTLVSHAAGLPTRPANGQSGTFAMSSDGRWLLVGSFATDLVADAADHNEGMDVFVYDRTSGAIELVSRAVGGTSTTADVSVPIAISDDGDTVLFRNGSNDVMPDVTAGTDITSPGLYLRRRSTGAVRLVNHQAGAPLTPVYGYTRDARLSADGRFVVYSSPAVGQVAGITDANASDDVFLYDAVTDTTELVSHDPADAATATGSASLLTVDHAADHVLFTRSGAVWLFDRGSGALTAIPGQFQAFLSADARFVAYADSVPPPGVISDLATTHVYLLDRNTGTRALLSHADGVPQHTANGRSVPIAISADGRRVLFTSNATDLVAGQLDGNSGDDLFVYDRSDASVRLVSGSVGSATRTAARSVQRAALSADGSVALFTSAAPDLLAEPDLNEVGDAFAVDLDQGQRRSLSRAVVERPAASGGSVVGVSPDGRWLLHAGPAVGIANPAGAITAVHHLVDTGSGQRILLGHRAGAPGEPGAAGIVGSAVLSANAVAVAFEGGGADLFPVPTPPNQLGLFLYERADDRLRLISHRDGAPNDSIDARFTPAAVSPDGRFLVYASAADGLVAGSNSGQRQQVYVWDSETDASELVSGARGSRTVGADDDSQPLALSDDGRYVLLSSRADDLVDGVAPAAGNGDTLYLRDRETKQTWLVSHRHGLPAAAASGVTAIGMSEDARFVLFGSTAGDLSTTTDANLSADVFVWDRVADRTELVSRRAGADAAADGVSTARAISADGRFVLFDSSADDLVAGAGSNAIPQVYLADRERGTVVLVSHALGSTTVGSASGAYAQNLSRDGRCLTFGSASSDLAEGAKLSGGNLYRWCRDRPIQRISVPVATVHAPSQGNVSAFDRAISPDGFRVLYVSSSGALDADVADPNSDYDALLAVHDDDLFRDDL